MSVYKCKIDVYDMYEGDYIDGQHNIFKNKYLIKMAIGEYFEKYIEPVVDITISNISGRTPYITKKDTIRNRYDISNVVDKLV